MEFKDLISKALEIRATYGKYEEKTYGKRWTKENTAEGFVGDVGDLMKLVLAKQGVQQIEEVDKKIAHELSDCLWSIIVLAQFYNVDLESAFLTNMDELKAFIERKLK